MTNEKQRLQSGNYLIPNRGYSTDYRVMIMLLQKIRSSSKKRTKWRITFDMEPDLKPQARRGLNNPMRWTTPQTRINRTRQIHA